MRESSLDQCAREALPYLLGFVVRLRDLSLVCVKNQSMLANDDFAFMAFSFVAKQIDHAGALEVLGEHPDAELVARSMLEGYVQLKWASHDIESRGRRWRAYAVILHWRAVSTGAAIDQDVDEARFRILFDQHHELFYTSAALRAKADGKRLPQDPYFRTWFGIPIRELFNAVGDGILYNAAYGPLSDWHHWSPASLAHLLSVTASGVTYVQQSFGRQASALNIAFFSLYHCAAILSGHLALPQIADLHELASEMLEFQKSFGLLKFPTDGELKFG
jgi:hypothetical protein